MSEDPLSILCSQIWHWDSREESQITFRQDSTGELICRAELNVWIAAELEWKVLGLGTAEAAKGFKGWWENSKNQPRTQLMLEITLTKRSIPNIGNAQMDRYSINESLIIDRAFRPKRYTVTLEVGKFTTQYDEILENKSSVTPRFKYRLDFNISPYPAREEWKDPEGAPDAMKFWEWTKFCAGQLE
ncbi:hypothetical protein ACHAQH_007601 [Verticillium albo-atrum]